MTNDFHVAQSATVLTPTQVQGAFFEAIYENNTIKAAEMLRAGASIEVHDNNGYNALHAAARHGRTDAVRLLVEQEPLMDAVTRDGFTALHLAARHGHTDTMRSLIKHGASPDALTGDFLFTPLHLAVCRGNSDAVRLLVMSGASVDMQDRHGLTALNWAKRNQFTDVVRILESPVRTEQPDRRSKIGGIETAWSDLGL